MAKPKKNKNKAKLNLTVREEQRNKLEQMASLESRSVSNLVEIMADERWERLAERQGIAYAKTVAEAMNLKLEMDKPADREKLRRAILDLVAERSANAKTASLKFSRSPKRNEAAIFSTEIAKSLLAWRAKDGGSGGAGRRRQALHRPLRSGERNATQ